MYTDANGDTNVLFLANGLCHASLLLFHKLTLSNPPALHHCDFAQSLQYKLMVQGNPLLNSGGPPTQLRGRVHGALWKPLSIVQVCEKNRLDAQSLQYRLMVQGKPLLSSGGGSMVLYGNP